MLPAIDQQSTVLLNLWRPETKPFVTPIKDSIQYIFIDSFQVPFFEKNKCDIFARTFDFLSKIYSALCKIDTQRQKQSHNSKYNGEAKFLNNNFKHAAQKFLSFCIYTKNSNFSSRAKQNLIKSKSNKSVFFIPLLTFVSKAV